MNDPGLGKLDGLKGIAFLDDTLIADVQISDQRQQEMIEVPLVGQSPGLKPGRITGTLELAFDEPKTVEFRQWLDSAMARPRQRTEQLVLRLELEGQTVIHRCRVGGHLDGARFAFEILIA